MAELDPYAPQEGQGNYLGYSRGSVPDTSLGGLFSDAATMVTGATKVVSDYMQNSARADYTRAHDEITGVFTGTRDPRMMPLGGEPYRAGAGTDRPETPAELQDYEQRLQALGDSYKSGKLQGSHYWAMLDMEARRVRQRFPGFREEIDRMVQGVSGAIPANRLVQELEQEARRGGAESRAQREYWLRQANQHGLDGDVSARAQAGNPVSDDELRNRLSVYNARTSATDVATKELSLRHARGQNITEDAVRQANQSILARQAQMLSLTTSGIGLGLRDVQARVDQLATSGNRASPDELVALQTQYNNTVLMPLRAAVDAEMYRTREGGMSFAAMINDRAKIDNVTSVAEGQLRAISEYLGKGDWSSLAQISTQLQAIQNGDHLSALMTVPYLRNLETATKILGNNFVLSEQFKNDASNTSDAMRALMDRQHVSRLANGESLTRQLTEARVSPDYRPEFTHTAINQNVRALANPKMTIQALTNFAASHFGVENNRFLDNVNNKAEVYALMTSDPNIAKNMLRLRDTPLYGQYREWIVNNFASSTQELINSTNNVNLNSERGERVNFSSSTNTFVYSGDRPEQRETVRKLNGVIAGVTNMLRAEGVDNATAARQVGALIGGLRFQENVTTRGSGVQQFWDAVRIGIQRSNPEDASQATPQPRNVAELADVIGAGEAGLHGYNQGFSRMAGPNGTLRPERYDLENMTIGQVQALQRDIIGGQRQGGVPEGRASSAMGRYQLLQNTLQEATTALGLNPATTKFDRTTQDAMFMYHANKLGLQNYLQGKLTTEQMMDKLSGFWAALPRADGSAGITTGQNAVNRSPQEVRQALEAIRRRFAGSGG